MPSICLSAVSSFSTSPACQTFAQGDPRLERAPCNAYTTAHKTRPLQASSFARPRSSLAAWPLPRRSSRRSQLHHCSPCVAIVIAARDTPSTSHPHASSTQATKLSTLPHYTTRATKLPWSTKLRHSPNLSADEEHHHRSGVSVSPRSSQQHL